MVKRLSLDSTLKYIFSVTYFKIAERYTKGGECCGNKIAVVLELW